MSKVWFITGASRGLGAEIARAAIDNGDDVVATARESSAVEKALGSSAHLMPVALDVTRRGAPEQAVKAAVARFGRIDVLVNNPGTPLSARSKSPRTRRSGVSWRRTSSGSLR